MFNFDTLSVRKFQLNAEQKQSIHTKNPINNFSQRIKIADKINKVIKETNFMQKEVAQVGHFFKSVLILKEEEKIPVNIRLLFGKIHLSSEECVLLLDTVKPDHFASAIILFLQEEKELEKLKKIGEKLATTHFDLLIDPQFIKQLNAIPASQLEKAGLIKLQLTLNHAPLMSCYAHQAKLRQSPVLQGIMDEDASALRVIKYDLLSTPGEVALKANLPYYRYAFKEVLKWLHKDCIHMDGHNGKIILKVAIALNLISLEEHWLKTRGFEHLYEIIEEFFDLGLHVIPDEFKHYHFSRLVSEPDFKIKIMHSGAYNRFLNFCSPDIHSVDYKESFANLGPNFRSLKTILKTCLSLKDLSLTGHTYFSKGLPNQFSNMLGSCKCLETLTLEVSKITPLELKEISKSCPSLKEILIDISYPDKEIDDFLSEYNIKFEYRTVKVESRKTVKLDSKNYLVIHTHNLGKIPETSINILKRHFSY